MIEKPRILVLTSSTGGGHDARAAAFQSWVEKLHGEEISVKIEQLLENASFITRVGVHIYNWIQKKAPMLHHLYWWVVEFFGLVSEHLILLGSSYFKRQLRQFRPHLILSLHDSTNRGYFRVAKDVLKPHGVSCVTYCGEFSGGYGFSRNWLTPHADLFISRTHESLEFAIKLGIKGGKTRIFTNFLAPETFENQLAKEDRQRYRKESLGLSAEKFTVFLATGKVGFNNHLRFLAIMAQYPEKIQAIAVCGKNKSALRQMSSWKEQNPHFSLYLEGYSDKFHHLIQSSDAIVTRGGANTATEALFFGCPLIFDIFRGLMPQERLTLNYFSRHAACAVVKSTEEIHHLLGKWMDFSENYEATRQQMIALQSTDRPGSFFQEMIDLARQRASGD